MLGHSPVQFGSVSTPQRLGPPPPQVSPLPVQLPHCTMPPQPSPIGPQFALSCWQVRGVQGGEPHTLSVPPPPQVFLPVQPPHCTMPPQPSLPGPHLPVQTWALVLGVQVTF